jgi:hypothetical protein
VTRWLVIVLSACTLDRSGLEAQADPIDAGQGPRDAGRDDPRLDAAIEGRDADRGVDAGRPDAGFDADPCGGSPDSDGDGVPDVCDPCPDDREDDSDGDTVCDSDDRCEGDDRIDGDGDSIADACDDWPCGTEPSVPESASRDGATIDDVSIDGSGRTAVVDRGTMTISVAMDYEIIDCGCATCRDQIEVGWSPGSRVACIYDAVPGCSSDDGRATRSFPVPDAPGRYDLRFKRAQDWNCNFEGRTDWWLGPPDPATTIGVLCVR